MISGYAQNVMKVCLQHLLFAHMLQSSKHKLDVLMALLSKTHRMYRNLNLLTVSVMADFDNEIRNLRYFVDSVRPAEMQYDIQQATRMLHSHSGLAPHLSVEDANRSLFFTKDVDLQCTNTCCYSLEVYNKLRPGADLHPGKLPKLCLTAKSLPNVDICLLCARKANRISAVLQKQSTQVASNPYLYFTEPYGVGGYNKFDDNPLNVFKIYLPTVCMVHNVDYDLMVDELGQMFIDQSSIISGPKNG